MPNPQSFQERQSALGARLSEYRGRQFYWLGLSVLLAGPLLAFLAVKVLTEAVGGCIGFLGIMCIPLGLMLLAYSSSNHSIRVCIHQHGFVYKKGRVLRDVRWSDIAGVQAQVIRNYLNFIYLGNNYKCHLILKNRTTFTLDDRIHGIQAISDVIAREVERQGTGAGII